MHNLARLADCFDACTTRALRSGLDRISTWPPPPNWSFLDWSDEVSQLAQVAAWAACCEPQQPPECSPASISYNRILGRVLTYYRQEWAYACRTRTDLPLDAVELDPPRRGRPCAMLQSHANASQGLVACLLAAIEELSPDQKRIIAELFWREVSETELGRKLGISRRALNKRKHRILRDLRALLPARLPTEPCSKRLGAGISSLPDSKQPP